MHNGETPLTEIPSASRRLVKRAMNLGANRVELLLVELQEERERVMQTVAYGAAVAVLALLGGISLTIFIVLLTWGSSPLVAAGVLTLLYFGAAAFLYVRLGELRRNWQTFSASLNQLRKDSECLNELLH